MHEGSLFFSFTSEALAGAVSGALSPESESEVPKTRSEVALEGREVRVRIVAEDLASLRAALNSYLRWADAAERAASLGRPRA